MQSTRDQLQVKVKVRRLFSVRMTSTLCTCPLCPTTSSTLREYVSHLRIVHSKDAKFNVICGVGRCREVFHAFSAFNSHIYRHHRDLMGLDRAGENHLNVHEASSFSGTSSFVTNGEDAIEPQDELVGYASDDFDHYSVPCQEYGFMDKRLTSFKYQQNLHCSKNAS